MCQRRYKCLHCGAEDVETLPELKSYMHPFLLPLLLPPRYINTIHRLYESVSMLSGSQSCLHSLPCIISLPPLFFSDTEKLTPPPPSLLACFCPPYSSGRQHRTLFFFFFLTRSRCNIMSSICIFSVQSPPPATQLNMHSHHLCHVVAHSPLPPSLWITVDVVLQPPLKTGFAYKSIACCFAPLCSLFTPSLAPSLFLSASLPGNPLFFFFYSVFHVAFLCISHSPFSSQCASLPPFFCASLPLISPHQTERGVHYCVSSVWVDF